MLRRVFSTILRFADANGTYEVSNFECLCIMLNFVEGEVVGENKSELINSLKAGLFIPGLSWAVFTRNGVSSFCFG